MSGQTEDIVGLVDAVVRPLIEFEDDLEIQASETEDGGVLVEVRVHEEDAGKVIGRQGRVIKAIRTLARAVASRTGTPCRSGAHRLDARLGRRRRAGRDTKNLNGGLVARCAPGLPFLLSRGRGSGLRAARPGRAAPRAR